MDPVTCNTETCENEATHVDQFTEPICEECVKSAVSLGESEDNFKPISGYEVSYKISPDELTQVLDSQPAPDTIKPKTYADTSELTIFEESLTETGLAEIKKQAAGLPVIAKIETDYNTVYELCTRLKRVSVAARKKSKSINDNLKNQFNTAKGKVETDLNYVLGVIDPIIASTVISRDYMESWIEAKKENKAIELAKVAEIERSRIHIFSIYDQAHDENTKRDTRIKKSAEDKIKKEQEEKTLADEKIRLKNESDRLERERYEFEIERSRLSVEDALEDCHWEYPDGKTMIISEDQRKSKYISQEQLDNDLGISEAVKKGIEETFEKPENEGISLPTMTVMGNSQDMLDAIVTLKEFAKDEPIEPMETETFATSGPKYEGKKLTDKDIEAIENQLGPSDRDVIDTDKHHIKTISEFTKMMLETLTAHDMTGFVSPKSANAVNRLVNDIRSAVDRFNEATLLSDPDCDVTSSDCPF